MNQQILASFYSSVGKFPLLDKDQEISLTISAQQGNKDAKDLLVNSNLRLVVKIAKEYSSPYFNIMDLIQEGSLGLCFAVMNFDTTQGVRFGNYACNWIKAYILKFLMNGERQVKIGKTATQRKIFYQLDKVRAKIYAIEGEATLQQSAEALGVKEKDITDLELRLQGTKPFDVPMGEEGRSLNEMIADTTENPEQLNEKQNNVMLLRNALPSIGDLDERDQAILYERLLADEPKSLEELGAQFGVSREQIRQQEKTLLQGIKQRFNKNLTVREKGYLQ